MDVGFVLTSRLCENATHSKMKTFIRTVRRAAKFSSQIYHRNHTITSIILCKMFNNNNCAADVVIWAEQQLVAIPRWLLHYQNARMLFILDIEF
jgi:hypothetical protein